MATSRAYRRTTGPYPLTLTPTTSPLPAASSLGPYDVLLRIRAVALNFRDVAMLHEGRYPVRVAAGGIPGSDCAGEVVRVGEKVEKFRTGDRVAPTFDLAHLTGEGGEREAGMCALGGDVDGVLREWGVWQEEVLVALPGGLGWEEVSGGGSWERGAAGLGWAGLTVCVW
ncbi:hypothetical protein SLS54_007993 [Diplodia seriata]